MLPHLLRPTSRLRVLAFALAATTLATGCRGGNAAEARVVVPKGASLRMAADSLAKAGVVGNAAVFRLYALLAGRDRSIRAGTYLFKPGVSWSEVLGDLHGGKGIEHAVTIVEGWSLNQIVPQIARALGAPLDSVQAAVHDTALLHALDIPTPTLEGYLFPDTYVFPEGATARQAVRTMVARYQRVWQPEWNEQLQHQAMSRHDVMSLAAIVEKEARLPEERPVIAAVYLNRLKSGMLLQADPTVQYAIGHHVARVFYKDLEIESPYNTYRYKGLPPGPIASPGKPAIVAALYPANVPYRYFVAHPDGHHEFTTSFAEHSVAVKGARREWDSVAAVRRDAALVAPANVLPGAVAASSSLALAGQARATRQPAAGAKKSAAGTAPSRSAKRATPAKRKQRS